MARSSKTGGKARAAKTRKARSVRGRKPAKTKASAKPTTNRPKRSPASASGKELMEAREQQAATAEVLEAINRSGFDLDKILQTVVSTAARLCKTGPADIFLLEGGVYRYRTGQNLTEAYREHEKQAEIRAGLGTLVGRVALKKGIVHIVDALNDIAYDDKAAASANNFRSMLGVPLLRDGEPVGVFALARTRVEPFSESQIRLVATFANQAVIAIENTRLFNETKEALERQTATTEVLEVINASPGDLAPVFDAMLQKALSLCGAAFGQLVTFDGAVFRAAAWRGYEPGPGATAPLPGMALYQLVHGEQIVHIPDITADDVYRSGNPVRRRLADQYGGRTAIWVALRKDEELLGAFVIFRTEVRPFSDKQIALLQGFAAQAVIAIENARLLNEVQARTRDLQESLQQQTATADVLKVISRSAFDLDSVLNTLVESAVTLSGADAGTIYQKRGELYHLTAQHGHAPEVLQYGRANPLAPSMESNVGRTAMAGAVVEIPDVLADPDYAPHGYQRVVHYRAMLGIPLKRDGKVEGVFSLVNRSPGPFERRHIELVQTFADQAVIAIENARLFNETQEALERQTATADILKVIASSPSDVQPVFEAISERSNQLVNGSSTSVLSIVNDALHLMAYTRVNPAADAALEAFYPQPLSTFAWGEATRRGEITHIPDSEDEAATPIAVRDVGRARGWRSAMLVPLLRDQQSIGMIIVTRREPGLFADHHVQLLQTFADQAVIAIENTRLFNETREALERQTATSNILSAISNSVADAQPVFEEILHSIAGPFEAEERCILLLGEDGFLHIGAYHGPGVERARTLFPRPLMGSATETAIRDRRLVQYPDVFNGPDVPPGLREYARAFGKNYSLILMPMLRDDRPIGSILINSTALRVFTEKECALLRSFADQAVIAIENARLFDEVQARTRELSESLEQQTATSEVLGVISRSAGDLEPVFQSMLENATRICGAQFGLMNLLEGDSVRTVAFHNVPPEFLSARKDSFRPRPDGILAQIIRTRQLAHTPDLSATALYAEGDPPTRHLVDLAGARTILVVPMLKDDELVGTIGIYRREVSPFNDKQIALLSSFASQAVIAIENARLLNELRQRTDDLSKSLDDLRAAQDRLIQTEKLASLGQLTAGIAHEIKNPLNFVNNFSALSAELVDEMTDVFENAALDEASRRKELDDIRELLKSNLEKVVQHGKRADSIVKNMLLHSREGKGERRSVDINALVEESLNLAYHGARAEGRDFNIALERDFDPAVGVADVYPQEITRVLLNLISNGFYAATQRAGTAGNGFEPRLKAITRNLGDRVEIRIRDNGTGIPPEVKDKMFNPFFTTKPAGEGTGLGLSMSHDIVVKQHGGTIDVETEPGAFTEIIVTLP